MTGARVCVVDDDEDHRESLCDLLGAAGYEVVDFASAEAALGHLSEVPVDLILSDLRMPRLDGIGFLDALAAHPQMPAVVMLSGHGDIQHAVRAMRAGAQDFLEKPYDAEHLLSVMERCLQTQRMRGEIDRLQKKLAARDGFIGDSSAIAAVRETLRRVAPMEIDVILYGETGTGKELAARLLHRGSPRAARPFRVVNCASLSEADVDVELFGRSRRLHGLAADEPGQVTAADSGTLLLDQIDTLSLGVQKKLLRVLRARQDDEAEGFDAKLDFRIICTSCRSLKDAMHAGQFRDDLYYRLSGYEINLPALRERPGDIPILYEHFLREAAARHGRQAPAIDFLDRKALQANHWPGNCHELRGMAEHHVLGLNSARRGARGVSRAAGHAATLRDLVTAFEAKEIARVLEQCKGNTEAAARILNIPRRTLNDKIAKNPDLKRDA